MSLAAIGHHAAAHEALLRTCANASTSPELLPWIEQRLRSSRIPAAAGN